MQLSFCFCWYSLYLFIFRCNFRNLKRILIFTTKKYIKKREEVSEVLTCCSFFLKNTTKQQIEKPKVET
jgi:hypothetical protein